MIILNYNLKYCILLLLFCLSILGQEKRFTDLENTIDSLASNNLFSGSVLVAHDSTIQFYYSAGFENRRTNTPINGDTKFELASITKSFTAVIILKLFEENLIDLNKPITEYINWYPNKRSGEITAHHLLAHQSGIINYTAQSNWPQLSTQKFDKKEFVNLFAKEPLEFVPGAEFSYSNSNYYLLGLIAEKVTGKSFGNLLSELIFEKADMTSSGVLKSKNEIKNLAIGYEKLPNGFIDEAPQQDYSTAFSVSGIYTTPLDLLKFSNALSDNLLLKKETKEKLFTPNKQEYGYGFVISRISKNNISKILADPFSYKPAAASNELTKIIWHWGSNPGYNTLFVKIPVINATIIIFENLTQLNSDQQTRIYDLAQEAILLMFND